MGNTQYKTYKRRWLVIFALVPIIVMAETYWLAFAPISSAVEAYFGVDEMSITLFAMSYMLMAILLMMPASWMIDKYGFKRSVMLGTVVLVVAAVLRYVFAENFTVAIICQFAMAAAQPFLINITTKVPSNWFPIKERATASGILMMAQYIGFIIPMAFASSLFAMGMKNMMGIYALITVIAAVVMFAFTREKPPIEPGPPEPKEDLNFRSIKALFARKQYLLVLFVGFISIGLLNTLLSMIESILAPKGMMEMAGIAGVVFIVAGIAGAVIVPLISDKIQKRMALIKGGILLLVCLLAVLAFVDTVAVVMTVYGLMGFLVMGLAPILFQHGAETAYPSKEGTSFGLVMLMGQVSGLVFVLLFEIIGETSALWSMVLLLIFAVVQTPAAIKMRDSDIYLREKSKAAERSGA